MNNAGIVDLIPEKLRKQWVADGSYSNVAIYELFRRQAMANPDRDAVLSMEDTLSYGKLLHKVHCLANSFKAMGIMPGDVVAYQLINSWHSCAIDLAVAALGAVVAPFPPGRGKLDIESLLRRSGARAIIVERDYGGVDFCKLIEELRPTLLSLRYPIVDGQPREGWKALDQMFKAEPISIEQLPHVCPDSPVRLLVSSGTECEPKLVAYSHNAMIGGRGRFLQRLHPDGQSFRGLYLIPLGSSFGSTATFGVLAWLGGSIVLLPKFEPKLVIAAIEKLRPSYILGVPTMFQRIAAHADLAKIDRSSLKAIISGGSVVDKITIERCIQAFDSKFINLYGSADGVNCHNTLDDSLDVVSFSVGRPNPQVCDIRIVNAQGEVLPDGDIGEVMARGPLSPMQYVNAPDLDKQYRDSQGWVFTGDLGFIDDNKYLVLAGRKKDIIIRGGANISPVQIEKLATEHPNVISAACVSVPDKDLGSRVCICITLRDSKQRMSLIELTDFLRQQGLETNKLPEYLRYYRELPLNPAGKLDKKKLQQDVSLLGSHKQQSKSIELA